MMGALRILIADDHTMVRQGLRTVLEARPGWVICGEATEGRGAVALAQALRPHVAILDFSMPELNGLEATRQIRKALPHTEVLILTMHHSEHLVRELVAAGARGYLVKSDAGPLLIAAVEALSRHQPFFSAQISQVILNGYLDAKSGPAPAEPKGDILTPREREVLQLIAEGKSTKEAAAALRLGVKTVETHRANLMAKLQLRSVADLVRYAIRTGVIEP